MKKTYNINLSGIVFTMDDDAYNLLNDYLDTLQHAFRHVPDSKELISDIEGRAAELLCERENRETAVVTLADVEAVIARIGQPEEMIEESISNETEVDQPREGANGTTRSFTEETFNGAVPPPYPGERPAGRKFFRDPQNAMIGGVCAGLAAYLNVDVTWVRLFTVALAFLSLSLSAMAYIVLWIVVPEARTPLQRMQMYGEAPTIQNIGRSVTDNYKDENGNLYPMPDNRTGTKRFLDNLAHICGVIAKLILIMIMIISIPILLGLGLGLLGCMFALIVLSTSWGASYFEEIPGLPMALAQGDAILGLLMAIGVILTIGIPFIAILWMALMKTRPITRKWKISLIVIWGIGFVMAGICGGILALHDEFPQTRHYERMEMFETDVDSTEMNYDEYLDRLAEENDSVKQENIVVRKNEKAAAKANKKAEKAQQKAEAAQVKAEKMQKTADKLQEAADKIGEAMDKAQEQTK